MSTETYMFYLMEVISLCDKIEVNINLFYVYTQQWGPGVAQWLRHCATSWAVSWIPTEPCVLSSTQPLKNEYLGVKAAGA